ncbi:hypothetical protein D3C77_247870 [compost metagenome]
MIKVARNFQLRINVFALAEQGQRFAVKQHLNVGKTTVSRCAYLVGAVDHHRTGTGQGEALLILGDDFKEGVIVERQALLRRHIVGHVLELGFSVRLIGMCSGCRGKSNDQ